MPKLVVALEFEPQHGCIVVRDTESMGDVSEAPIGSHWFFDRGSAILAVRPGIEGLVRCEVWLGTPHAALPTVIADEEFDIAGELEVEDPAKVVWARLAWVRGVQRLVVRVDEAAFPTRVQVIVDP